MTQATTPAPHAPALPSPDDLEQTVEKWQQLRKQCYKAARANDGALMGNDAWLRNALCETELELTVTADGIECHGLTYTSQTMDHGSFDFTVPYAALTDTSPSVRRIFHTQQAPPPRPVGPARTRPDAAGPPDARLESPPQLARCSATTTQLRSTMTTSVTALKIASVTTAPSVDQLASDMHARLTSALEPARALLQATADQIAASHDARGLFIEWNKHEAGICIDWVRPNGTRRTLLALPSAHDEHVHDAATAILTYGEPGKDFEIALDGYAYLRIDANRS